MKTNYKEGELLEFNEKGETKLFGLNYTEMVYVEKGTFNIGDNSSLDTEDEKEAIITFDDGYFISKYPVTQEFYEYITGKSPSKFKGKYRPVENISWNDVCIRDNCFLKQLNNKLEGKYTSLKGIFSLPSEAQWEYAARGGKAWNKPKLQFAGSNNIHDVGWFDENSNARTMPVGLKQPNILGLYDMSGNVLEWCMDTYIEDYQKISTNGKAYQQSGTYQVLRGGRWSLQVQYCGVAYRYYYAPDFRYDNRGFRLVFLPV